jgi:hypothetical protein
MTEFNSNVGQHHLNEYTVANPHPNHGKDPNIMNEYGHTHYPKFVHKHDEKGRHIREIVKGFKSNDKGHQYETVQDVICHSKIVNNEDEEAEANAEGYHYKPPPKGWDAKPAKNGNGKKVEGV